NLNFENESPPCLPMSCLITSSKPNKSQGSQPTPSNLLPNILRLPWQVFKSISRPTYAQSAVKNGGYN
ncbi:hypothetical protein CPB84DRAFT_1763607, partial [Gymnopilus junonius]